MSLQRALWALMRWAGEPDAPASAPPAIEVAALGEVTGDAIADLAEPDEPLCALTSHLAAIQAARLGWTAPPLGDARDPGPAALWLAAAVAARTWPALCDRLLRVIPAPECAWDLLLRHAIAGPVLAWSHAQQAGDTAASGAGAAAGASGDAPWLEAVCEASPLTGVLAYPPRGQSDRCLALAADTIIAHPQGASSLAAHFATPVSPGPRALAVLTWRAHALDRLRSGDQAQREFVLDVYEHALSVHRGALFAALESARAALGSASGAALAHALATARWWQPLWHLHRSWPESLRERPYLDVPGLLAGLDLCRRAQILGASATAAVRAS
ncbi:hypothetical protein Hoch_0195 [Haliangium ochraceum DSM 14365]|uniref:FtsH ternary system domain-containing protein n=1 Tax=Haliangium ochraceum (strain DSM 14365 / JCM 11303 / SMP-2) TaxID=502025 RepID=D0LHH4_HALO1|nr:hypothetical protein Hoch_0195 [Haliangium ochraceum DSM 14365]